VGRKAGITEAQLLDLARFEDSLAFDAAERLVLRLTVALTKTPANVDDQLFDALREQFSEPQLVELATAIAWENYRARFNRTFGILAEVSRKARFVRCRSLKGCWRTKAAAEIQPPASMSPGTKQSCSAR